MCYRSITVIIIYYHVLNAVNKYEPDLVSNLNEQCEYDDDKQVVNDADCSDANVDDFQSKVANVGKIS